MNVLIEYINLVIAWLGNKKLHSVTGAMLRTKSAMTLLIMYKWSVYVIHYQQSGFKSEEMI